MHSRLPLLLFVFSWLLWASGDQPSWADGPADNQVDSVRRIPKLGIEVPENDRQLLERGLSELSILIDEIRSQPSGATTLLLPDVLIFHRAVEQALLHQEFFDAKELPIARKLLEMGQLRATQLLAGRPEWTRQTGLIVKGYLSKIDGTVQPYGLVIPEDYDFESDTQHRLDLWFHGRGETLSEVNFLNQRLNQPGEYTPANTIVLHPYGRYCNANKFAGEIDTFEALESAKRFYRINPDRIAVRGFSMGGAACWQFAVHYPGMWFAANPGAGFSETPEFLKVFQNETLTPTWYEEKLWMMYDCTGYAANLAFLPTIAYSGEIDKQKQAADIMEAALGKEGLPLLHIIGPMTAHKIHPDSKQVIESTLSQWDRLGSPFDLKPPFPDDGGYRTVDQFVTYTLRYNQSRYFTIDALEEHWEPARIVWQVSTEPGSSASRITTSNISAFSLTRQRSNQPLLLRELEIDGQTISLSGPPLIHFEKRGGKWRAVVRREAGDTALKKRHGLQGPIDDAFMDAFVFVKPTATGLSPEVDAWVQAEFQRAVEHWRRQFRGDVRVLLDTEITKEDMQQANVVLWGDPRSNQALSFLNASLPIHWKLNDQQLLVGEQVFDAATHLPLMIVPNPLAPGRYLVLNSGFTYREYDYLNNARQTPKLPDWAIVDVRTPPNARFPGKVVAADFFDESWQLKPARLAEPNK